MNSLHAELSTASGGDEILHHLLMDFLIKGATVVLALVIVAVGVVVLRRKIGNQRSEDEPQRTSPFSKRRS